MMSFFKKLLGIFRKTPSATTKPATVITEDLSGTQGRLQRPVLVSRDEERITMVLDHNFEDVLAWAEYDCTCNKFSLVQKSGAVADLYGIIANDDIEQLRNYNRMFIVTSFNNKRIMHNLSLIVHTE